MSFLVEVPLATPAGRRGKITRYTSKHNRPRGHSFMNNDTIQRLNELIALEKKRQECGITLIASENYAYPEVLALNGSMLTNKYAEGYLTQRYYAGCEWVAEIESLAINSCEALFNADHANVQPHSGSNANLAVFMAFIKPGDTVLAPSLTSGGHLTHGQPFNLSGMFYKPVFYEVDKETELFKYDQIADLAQKHKPKLIISGTSSHSRIIDFQKMHAIAQSVEAYHVADAAHLAGLIATNHYPNPMPHADAMTGTTHKTLRGPRGGFIVTHERYAKQVDRAVFPGSQGGPFMHIIAGKALAIARAQEPAFADYIRQALLHAQTMVSLFKTLGYRIVSDGTDTHFFVLDLRAQKLTGLEAEKALEKAGIFVSRSAIPYDTEKPSIASGIRLGTLALTARGYSTEEVTEFTHLIDAILKDPSNTTAIEKAHKRIIAMHRTPCD